MWRNVVLSESALYTSSLCVVYTTVDRAKEQYSFSDLNIFKIYFRKFVDSHNCIVQLKVPHAIAFMNNMYQILYMTSMR